MTDAAAPAAAATPAIATAIRPRQRPLLLLAAGFPAPGFPLSVVWLSEVASGFPLSVQCGLGFLSGFRLSGSRGLIAIE